MEPHQGEPLACNCMPPISIMSWTACRLGWEVSPCVDQNAPNSHSLAKSMQMMIFLSGNSCLSVEHEHLQVMSSMWKCALTSYFYAELPEKREGESYQTMQRPRWLWGTRFQKQQITSALYFSVDFRQRNKVPHYT